MEDERRRSTDKSNIARFVDWGPARLAHQIISVLGIIGFGIFGFFAVHYTNNIDDNLRNLTIAMNALTVRIEGKIGGYDDHFADNDRRIDRIENSLDGRVYKR